eukprot:1962724-Amphidinium_carterae.1
MLSRMLYVLVLYYDSSRRDKVEGVLVDEHLEAYSVERLQGRGEYNQAYSGKHRPCTDGFGRFLCDPPGQLQPPKSPKNEF